MLDKLKNIFRLKKEEPEPTVDEKIEEAFNSLGADVIRLEVGDDLTEFSNLIGKQIATLRETLQSELGFVLPPVHVLQKDDLQENELVFYVRTKEVVHDFIVPNEETVEKYIYDTLLEIFENNIDDIFTMEYVEKYITKVQLTNSWLIWSISLQLRASEIKSILVNLIKEKKSIADINYVFEKIDECLSENRDCCHTWKPDVVSRRVSKEIC